MTADPNAMLPHVARLVQENRVTEARAALAALARQTPTLAAQLFLLTQLCRTDLEEWRHLIEGELQTLGPTPLADFRQALARLQAPPPEDAWAEEEETLGYLEEEGEVDPLSGGDSLEELGSLEELAVMEELESLGEAGGLDTLAADWSDEAPETAPPAATPAPRDPNKVLTGLEKFLAILTEPPPNAAPAPVTPAAKPAAEQALADLEGFLLLWSSGQASAPTAPTASDDHQRAQRVLAGLGSFLEQLTTTASPDAPESGWEPRADAPDHHLVSALQGLEAFAAILANQHGQEVA